MDLPTFGKPTIPTDSDIGCIVPFDTIFLEGRKEKSIARAATRSSWEQLKMLNSHETSDTFYVDVGRACGATNIFFKIYSDKIVSS